MRVLPLIAAGAVLALVAGCAGSGRPGTATKYRPAGIFGGYKDKQLAPDLWWVMGRSNGIAEEGYSQSMAFYRAAELADAAGFSYMEIIDQKGQKTMFGIGGGSTDHRGGEYLELTVRGKKDASPPSECRTTNKGSCFTLDVKATMDRIRPLLTFPEKKPK